MADVTPEQRRQLIELAQAAPDDVLDETVHDMFSAVASAINNGGYGSQVDALVEGGFTYAQIEKAIKDGTP